MRLLRTCSALVSLLLLALSAGQADAQDDHIRQANELAAHGDHQAAVRVLREAQVEAPSPRVDLNLAMALGELGRLREARRLLRRVVSSDANPLIVDAATDQLRQVEAQLPALTVNVEDAANELRIDDETLPLDGSSVRVELDPGEHHLELREQSGAVVARATVELARSERASIRLGRAAPRRAASPSTSSASSERAPSPGPPSPREAAATEATPAPPPVDLTPTDGAAVGDDPLPWVLLGTGAAAVVIGAVVTGAVLASQPTSTMGDVPPIVLGGP